MRELIIGCGQKTKAKVIPLPHRKRGGQVKYSKPTTLDINKDHKPDVVWDLESIPLPFEDNSFDEIHAYEILEHTGNQGDYAFFFAQFSDFHRILKPGGHLFATVPRFDSVWAWGDPSHKRIINRGSLVFLSQDEYEKQVGVTAMSDFRYLYKADFEVVASGKNEHNYNFILKAV